MKILFAGESWVIAAVHVKGVNLFPQGDYDESASDNIREICERAGFDFELMPSHKAIRSFPGLEELRKYDLVVLSDIGSDSFLLHPETLVQSKVRENRLISLCKYVQEGGGLAMFGGWNSFTGMGMRARYGQTPLAAVLPVTMYNYDDRNETPEGAHMRIEKPGHPIFEGVDTEWPPFLGYNRLMPKDGAEVLATCGEDVFLAVQQIGKGRACAYASDITTHWAIEELTRSPSYEKFILNLFRWLAGKK